MLLAILAMLPLAAVAQAAPTKPHIVFMLADGEPPATTSARRRAWRCCLLQCLPSSLPAYSAS